MKRRLFQLLSALSLLLCVTSAAIWIRSYFFADVVNAHGSRSTIRLQEQWAWEVATSRGRLLLFRRHAIGFSPNTPEMPVKEEVVPPRHEARATYEFDDSFGRGRVFQLFGFSWWHDEPDDIVVVPLWALCAATAVLPAWMIARVTRGRKRLRGCCGTCGYDLRASPEQCPECGTPAGAPDE